MGTKTNQRMPNTAQDRVVGLFEEMQRLREAVDTLTRRNRELAEQRQDLLEENRALRREATLVRLYEDLSLHAGPDDEARVAVLPPDAERLYRRLPVTFTFPLFFQRADAEGIEPEDARTCLLYFLKRSALSQTGSRLEKTGSIAQTITPSPPRLGAARTAGRE